MRWFLLLILASHALVGSEPIDLGTRRELFVDSLIIERLDGLRRVLHRPVPRETAIHLDRPWEGPFNFGMTAMSVGDGFRLYYRATTKEHGSFMCVAVSTDAVHWTKPNLGLVRVAGTLQNNVIATVSGQLTTGRGESLIEVFQDTRPVVPVDQRFKAFTLGPGVQGWISADGFRWKKVCPEPIMRPALPGAFDGLESMFWSETEQRYICYFRYSWEGNGERLRSIARATSVDFLHWTDAVPMQFKGGELRPPFHLYINQTIPYFRAPHLYLAFPARFMHGRRVLTPAQVDALPFTTLDPRHNYYSDCSDTILMSTRAGTHRYDFEFEEGFIRPGIGPENWGSRSNYALHGLFPTGPTELSMFVNRHYVLPSWHIQRLTLRTDGLASIKAPYEGGEWVSKPLTFTGSRLELNYSTSAAGSLQVEIQDTAGHPIPGFRLEESIPIIGDETDRSVHWNVGEDVSTLRGRPVRLRFRMNDADLYSIRFPQ